MSDDFEIVKSTRNLPASGEMSSRDQLVTASANNFPRTLDTIDKGLDTFNNIIGLAKDIADIQRIKVQSEAVLQSMVEQRKMLLAEADAYVQKKTADTHEKLSVIDTANMMLRDFYTLNKKDIGLTGDQFVAIITEVLSKV